MHINNTHNNYHKRHKVKYIIIARIPKITINFFFYFFSSLSVRIITSNINFNDKKIKKVTFTIKTKKYLI